jgi:hypothetical protein
MKKALALALVALSVCSARLAAKASPNPANPATIATTATSNAYDQQVFFNTSSKKYHCATCTWAKRCTTNCITTTLADAKARVGSPARFAAGHANQRISTRISALDVATARCLRRARRCIVVAVHITEEYANDNAHLSLRTRAHVCEL